MNLDVGKMIGSWDTATNFSTIRIVCTASVAVINRTFIIATIAINDGSRVHALAPLLAERITLRGDLRALCSITLIKSRSMR